MLCRCFFMGNPGFVPVNGESVIRFAVEMVPCPDCGGGFKGYCAEDAGIGIAEGGNSTPSLELI